MKFIFGLVVFGFFGFIGFGITWSLGMPAILALVYSSGVHFYGWVILLLIVLGWIFYFFILLKVLIEFFRKGLGTRKVKS